MTRKLTFLIITCILCAAFIFSLNGCGKEEEVTTTIPTTVTTTTTTTTEPTTEPPLPANFNNLTGLTNISNEAAGKRPIAVMINNIKSSLPQYGIYSADIMLETLVEGGITRMMALYADYTKVPKICSVRSCRYYYPIFAHGFDAVYFCFGSNESLATPTLERIGIDYFDGNKTYDSLVFGRDSNRLKSYSREHTAYVNGANIPQMLKKYSVRDTYAEGKNVPVFNFRAEGDKQAAGDTIADNVRLNFSNSYYSTFKYDTESKVYYKTHCGNAHIDSANGKQLNYTNVFVLEAVINNYKSSSLQEIDWSGGTGYYISCGKAEPILWRKTSESANIELYRGADGSPLTVNAGNSYIGIIKTGCTKITANAQ